MLLVIDLETTGLNPKVDKILECAAIGIQIVKGCIEQTQMFNCVVPYDINSLVMDDFVTNMHNRNGLIRDVENLYTVGAPFHGLDYYLTAFATSLVTEKRKINLVGNSIHFDRSFLAETCPNFCAYLSHRMVDVSSFHLVYDALNPEDPRPKMEPAHRAYDDCLSSITQLSTYLHKFNNSGKL